jgi:hypothetical protein
MCQADLLNTAPASFQNTRRSRSPRIGHATSTASRAAQCDFERPAHCGIRVAHTRRMTQTIKTTTRMVPSSPNPSISVSPLNANVNSANRSFP